ncbi:hypothetical protein [Tunturiibacter gelidoferens]|uniref:Uncharacterized protein n=1 Tax=Tunturiibacter gelidiferens TaxID=3069689 RepID=A0ACC5P559_9BACT|nr:hypothetical protein [Edaphobacter lichenicola]MBB5341997.1 hypothetical protein [Edaphobacter lichenicola]
MLLAELHGKRFPEAEGQEDWLTSAVFGNLRHIPPTAFWSSLFERALSVGDLPTSLASQLRLDGVAFDRFTQLMTLFWKSCSDYGEPDLILRFTGNDVHPLVVLVEVKLNSTKSGVGENDQLARYLALLNDQAALPGWECAEDHRYLIYLTRAFAKRELEDSVRASGSSDAARRMFGLEWRDVLETAASEAGEGSLLEEVARFLKGRGFEAFRGFRKSPLPIDGAGGRFYGSEYFLSYDGPVWAHSNVTGRFYGR